MRDSYDFSKGKRGRITAPSPEPAGKVKITIRLDLDIVNHFMARADESGGAVGYQTLINEALRRSLEAPALEVMVRRVIREELKGRPDATQRDRTHPPSLLLRLIVMCRSAMSWY